MITNHTGEFAALLTAVFWTVTALAFEVATKRVGPYSVNVIRLSMAFVFLGIFTYFRRGLALPLDAGMHAWFWLSVSGVVGFIVGDLFLFASYPIISSRVAMLLMTLAPPMAAFIGWLVLGETMTLLSLAGMVLVVVGIGMTIWGRPDGGKKFSLNFSAKGLLFAFLGAVGQAVGLVLSKLGMGSYDPFAATQIRIIAALTGFVFIISFLGKWKKVFHTFTDTIAISRISLGSFFGPFLGVSFSLVAVQHTSAGIAATLMSIVPVLIILPSVILFKQKVTLREIVGAVISVAGVSLFFV
jgi:drug/metabolite transporter (DMT)-like permease